VAFKDRRSTSLWPSLTAYDDGKGGTAPACPAGNLSDGFSSRARCR
jgi:hypothetical protein